MSFSPPSSPLRFDSNAEEEGKKKELPTKKEDTETPPVPQAKAATEELAEEELAIETVPDPDATHVNTHVAEGEMKTQTESVGATPVATSNAEGSSTSGSKMDGLIQAAEEEIISSSKSRSLPRRKTHPRRKKTRKSSYSKDEVAVDDDNGSVYTETGGVEEEEGSEAMFFEDGASKNKSGTSKRKRGGGNKKRNYTPATSSNETVWNSKYEQVKAFQEKYNRLPKVKESSLGMWLSCQKSMLKDDDYLRDAIKLKEDRFNKLKALGVEVSMEASKRVYKSWEDNYLALAKFKHENHRLPKAKECYLSQWLRDQKTLLADENHMKEHPKVKEERIRMIEELGAKVGRRKKWEEFFDQLVTYCKENGRLPQIKDGELCQWFNRQKLMLKDESKYMGKPKKESRALMLIESVGDLLEKEQEENRQKKLMKNQGGMDVAVATAIMPPAISTILHQAMNPMLHHAFQMAHAEHLHHAHLHHVANTSVQPQLSEPLKEEEEEEEEETATLRKSDEAGEDVAPTATKDHVSDPVNGAVEDPDGVAV